MPPAPDSRDLQTPHITRPTQSVSEMHLRLKDTEQHAGLARSSASTPSRPSSLSHSEPDSERHTIRWGRALPSGCTCTDDGSLVGLCFEGVEGVEEGVFAYADCRRR